MRRLMRHRGDVARRKPDETDVSVNAGTYSTGQQSKFNEGQQCRVSLFFAPLINRTVIARPCASLGANTKRNSGLITQAMSS
jgi:hypothetical protein